MRLGLVGRGPQAQRYLMPKNGGQHIVSQVPGRIGAAEYQDWLEGVDGVIIATHPDGHRWLALDAIEAGKHVLIEKPLALNLEDCEEILDAAERVGVMLEVAHTYLWDPAWNPQGDNGAVCRISFAEHKRDYSAWLDWGPHALALLAFAMPESTPEQLLRCVCIEPSFVTLLQVRGFGGSGSGWSYVPSKEEWPAPMWLMVLTFMMTAESKNFSHESYDFQRRVYRALFAGENNATR